jgi:hypothetical protein
MTRSISQASAIITAMVPMIASQIGKPNFSISPTRVNAANKAITPCAKLNMPEALKMSTNPSATREYMTPAISPLRTTSIKKVMILYSCSCGTPR